MLSFVIYFSNTFRSTDFPGMLQLICVFPELSERNKTEDIRISSGVFWCSGKENCIIVPTSDSPFLGKMQSRPQGAKLLNLNRCYWTGIRKSCNLHVVTSQVAKWVCFLVSSQSKSPKASSLSCIIFLCKFATLQVLHTSYKASSFSFIHCLGCSVLVCFLFIFLCLYYSSSEANYNYTSS